MAKAVEASAEKSAIAAVIEKYNIADRASRNRRQTSVTVTKSADRTATGADVNSRGYEK
jgi:hypothetical protein